LKNSKGKRNDYRFDLSEEPTMTDSMFYLTAAVIAFTGVLAMGVVTAHSDPFDRLPNQQEQRSFYDRDGHFAGQSSTLRNTSSFTDQAGRFSGSSIRNSDGTTSFYDRAGHFTGSAGRPRSGP
jgi:hypothetical protein